MSTVSHLLFSKYHGGSTIITVILRVGGGFFYIRLMIRYILVLPVLLMVAGVEGQSIPKFDVQGHRGARGLYPENTIPAFMAALDYGVTTVEMDLAVTKDHRLVVSHDPWMSASICLTPEKTPILPEDEKKYNIYQMTYGEVLRFDCGSKGNDRFPEQEHIALSKPLLSDVIGAIEDHIKSYSQYEVDYNIEIKSTPGGDNRNHPTPEVFSDLVYNLLDQYLPMNRVVIQSFDFRVLQYWHKKYPRVRLAALVENKQSVSANLAALGFTPSIYSPDFTLLSKTQVDYLHQKRIRVIPWTVNEPDDMRRLKAWRVDGIITDYPNRTRELGLSLPPRD